MSIPEIMLVAPPKIKNPRGEVAYKFKGAEKKDINLASELGSIAKAYSVHYFNSTTVTEASCIDGIHLDENQHSILGRAIAQAVSESISFA